MMNFSVKNFWPVSKFFGAGCLGVACLLGFETYQKSGPSVIINSVDTVDDTVRALPQGDSIAFHIKMDRDKQCPSTVARYVWHNVWINGKQIHDYHSIDNPPLSPEPELGESEYILTLRVQSGLQQDDRWYERTVTYPQCSLFSWLSFNKPTVADHPIKVE